MSSLPSPVSALFRPALIWGVLSLTFFLPQWERVRVLPLSIQMLMLVLWPCLCVWGIRVGALWVLLQRGSIRSTPEQEPNALPYSFWRAVWHPMQNPVQNPVQNTNHTTKEIQTLFYQTQRISYLSWLFYTNILPAMATAAIVSLLHGITHFYHAPESTRQTVSVYLFFQQLVLHTFFYTGLLATATWLKSKREVELGFIRFQSNMPRIFTTMPHFLVLGLILCVLLIAGAGYFGRYPYEMVWQMAVVGKVLLCMLLAGILAAAGAITVTKR